jgi:hypothetical protein
VSRSGEKVKKGNPAMHSNSSVQALAENAKRMLDVIQLLGDHNWLKESKTHIKRIQRRLEAVSLAPAPILDPSIELEFYAIIESHPKLRQASQLVFKGELVDICKEGLAYYSELRRKRPLTSQELDQLSSVQEEYKRAVDELDQLREELLREDNGTT